MKFNITTIELWFWRIGVLIAILMCAVNYSDNRKQDKLIFKTIDSLEFQVEMDRLQYETDKKIFEKLESINPN